mgnify:FL=1
MEFAEVPKLTQEQLDFIQYLKDDFYYEIDDYEDAKDLIECKYSFKIHALDARVRGFMDNLLRKKGTFSSSTQYNTALANLLAEVEEVFLSSRNEPQNSPQSIIYSHVSDKFCQPSLSIDSNSYQPQGKAINSNGIAEESRENSRKDVSIMKFDFPQVHHKIETDLKNIECRIEYREIEIYDLKPLLFDFIETFTGVEISLQREGLNKYSPVEKIQVTDELGLWTYDHLQGVMDISFRLKNGGPLPKKLFLEKGFFKNTPNSVVFVNTFSDAANESQKNKFGMSLEDFLKEVADANGKDPKKYVAEWKMGLEGNHVDRLEELLAWDERDWEKASIKVNAAKLIRSHLNQFRFKSDTSKEVQTLSKAEKYAVLHRIKRFLIWKTRSARELEDIEYLDEKALKFGFEEIREKYIGEYLLSQLESFYEAFTIAKSYSKSLMLNRGMLLFGPPGTGKTVLTDILPSKIGLTPISYPLCASEVNRSLVGQTEKLLLELVSRAERIPYLLCCLAVDEIDGLAPKRDEKSGQHKIDALAVLLSVIGGIKDVKNLMFLASTNRLNQMDDAFKRRMSGQFFVGRPSPEARRKIIKASEATNLSDNMIDQVVDLTTNFSGAALKQYISYIVSETKKYNKQNNLNGKESLSYNELADLAAKTSKQFNIRLGNYSLPELFALQKQRECLMDASFLHQLGNYNQAILNFQPKIVQILYRRDRFIRSKIRGKRPEKKIELEYLDLVINENCKSPKDFIESLQLSQDYGKPDIALEVDYIDVLESYRFQENIICSYLDNKIRDFEEKCKMSKNIFIMVWADLIERTTEKINPNFIVNWFKANYKRLSMTPNLYHFFITNESNCSKLFEMMQWKNLEPMNKKEIKFTGKILVDLSEEDPEMRFEIEEKIHENGEPICLHSEPLLMKKDSVINSFQVIPKLAEFASRRGIDFILLMDQDFLLSNNAFDEAKIKENITEKMQEFSCYEKSLLIVDVDSLVGIAKSVSESSMGISTSYNVTDNRLYSMIIHYARSLPKILPKCEYWIALISKNRELSNMIKKDLSWPMTQKQIEEFKAEQKKQEETPCLRCRETYIEAKNELNQCSYHDGFLFEVSAPPYEWQIIEEERKAKELALKKNALKKAEQQPNQNKEAQFVYICCLQPINSQGCKKYKHISDIRQFDASRKMTFNEYQEKYKSLKNMFSLS